jgi:2-hydroxychromene-2-carboxylate isomerase
MTHVEVWFDVGCEWTWLTAEWVRQVASHRELDVRWRVYSLTLRKLGDTAAEPGRSFTLGAARVLEAVWADHGDAAIGPLYAHMGRAVHDEAAPRDRTLLERALAATALDPRYADAAADPRWDAEVRGSMADGDRLAGADVAVPILAIGDRPGWAYGGPVLSRRLGDDAALRVWDAYAALAAEPAFFELKRTRTASPQV